MVGMAGLEPMTLDPQTEKAQFPSGRIACQLVANPQRENDFDDQDRVTAFHENAVSIVFRFPIRYPGTGVFGTLDQEIKGS